MILGSRTTTDSIPLVCLNLDTTVSYRSTPSLFIETGAALSEITFRSLAGFRFERFQLFAGFGPFALARKLAIAAKVRPDAFDAGIGAGSGGLLLHLPGDNRLRGGGG